MAEAERLSAAAVMPIEGLVVVDDAALWEVRVCGLSLLTRAVASLARAGAETVHVVGADASRGGTEDGVRRELLALTTRPNVTFGARPTAAAQAVIVVAQPAAFDPRILDRLKAADLEVAGVVAFRRPADRAPALWWVGSAEVAGLSAADAPAPWLLGRTRAGIDPGLGLCDLFSETSRASVVAKIMTQARKASDSWVARHVDRRVSLWMTKYLLELPVTPNQITVASTGVGLLGALLLGWGTYAAQLAGALLLTFSIVVDGCDGEVARIKFQESDFGRKLDFFLDNLVNVAAIFAVGAGYAWRSGEGIYWTLSLVNAAAAAASVWPVYVLFFREGKQAVRLEASPAGDASQSWTVAALLEGVAGRDFAYVVLALAVFGKAHWFTLVCFVGLLGFLMAVGLLWLLRGRPSVARQ